VEESERDRESAKEGELDRTRERERENEREEREREGCSLACFVRVFGRNPIPVYSLLFTVYRGTSLIRNSDPLGPYSGTMHRALWWS